MNLKMDVEHQGPPANSSPGTQVPPGFRSGFVGIVGKPNVGKSTMLNALLGHKVSITSPKPQTTRRRILGIRTDPRAQVIFLDTPGWHRPKDSLGRYMVSMARNVFEEADVLIAVIDAVSGIKREDEWVFEQIQKSRQPALLAINKVDRVKKGVLLPIIEACATRRLFQEHIPVSATAGDNMDTLLAETIKYLPEGPRWYDPGQLTDQSTEQLIGEFIREAVLAATRQEVPQAVAVQVGEVATKGTVTVIQATIIVEREGQKAIVIGKGGQLLKRIGQQARLELERWLGRKVFLELWVKVAESWRKNPRTLRELGYAD